MSNDDRGGTLGTSLYRTQVERLSDRMAAEWRRLILHAADAGVLPAAGALARIADVEAAIVATETLLDIDWAPQDEPRR